MVRSSGIDADVFVCRDLWEETEREYLLIAVKNQDVIYRCAPFFTEQSENPSFKDFVECFSSGGMLFIVFTHYNKPRFDEIFSQETYFLRERLEIGKSLLSRMVLQNMPTGIQFEALQNRNLLLDSSLQIYFNYALGKIPSCRETSLNKVQLELGRIFRLLLQRELATKVAEEIKLFLEDLERGNFKDYLEIYEAYDHLYLLLKRLQEKGELQPKSTPFRVWEWIKAISRFMRPVLVGAIMVTVVWFLIYTASNPSIDPVGAPVAIDAIGTVDTK